MALAGCAEPLVATDVQTLDKPVATKCQIKWPAAPTQHVGNVQLTGNRHLDALLVWRATEAELEERRAYELKLEAAARACVDGG